MLYLLDSSAVLNDFSFEFKQGNEYITTPLAIDEFRDMRSRHLAENALQQGTLKIGEPSQEHIRYVEEMVRREGFSKLSKTDISILALAVAMKKKGMQFVLVTDDYSIQNFCKLLKIPFESVIRGKIKSTISFSLQCPACGKTLPAGQKPKKCPDCGSPLKRVKNNQK